MRQSDIWNSFIKIAEEKGMIPSDAPEKAIKILEKNPRWGSDTKEKIEKLYNLKPETSKDMKYDKNISYYAHPEPVIVAPSYDKLNGLVENINERQNILLNIVNKQTNGLSTQHKYAEQQLVLSLVRIANDLDNKNQDELRSLADICLVQASTKSIRKEAFTPLALAGVLAVPALIGALWVQQHLSSANEGFDANHKKLSAELNDLLESNSDWGVGYQFNENFKSTVQEFKNKLDDFYALYKKNESIIFNIEKPRDAKDLLQLSAQPETVEAIQAYKALRQAFDIMLPYVMQIQKDFSSESYKSRQIEDKGILSSLVDRMQVFHGGKGLIADDFDDVVNAIPPYLTSVQEILKVLEDAKSLQDKAKNELAMAASKSQELLGDDFGGAEKDKASEEQPVSRDLDKETADLEKELSDAIDLSGHN